jgi:predicted nucleic-acid-binding protein
MRVFIDTNLFLRYLLNDIPQQADAVEEILEKAAEGKLELWANPMVIAEIVWTCESYYELPRDKIRDKVLMILNTPGLAVEDEDLVAEAAILYAEKGVDFIDAYNACWMRDRGIPDIYTFDKGHYRRLEEIRVHVPGEGNTDITHGE